MLKLADSYTRDLLDQPESGMGYQLVEATLLDSKTKRGIAYDAELLRFDDEPHAVMLRAASYRKLLELAKSSVGEIKALRVLPGGMAALVGGEPLRLSEAARVGIPNPNRIPAVVRSLRDSRTSTHLATSESLGGERNAKSNGARSLVEAQVGRRMRKS